MDTKYGYKIEWQFVNVNFWCTRYPSDNNDDEFARKFRIFSY